MTDETMEELQKKIDKLDELVSEGLFHITARMAKMNRSIDLIKKELDRWVEDDEVGSESWNRANGIEPPYDSPSLQDDAYHGTMMDIQQHELGGGR